MTDLDHRSFARRTGTIAAGQAVVKSSQLVITVVLVRLLSPGEWTRVAFLLSIYLAAVTVGTLNLQHGIVFFLPRLGDERRRALLVQTSMLLGATGAVIAIGLVAASPAMHAGQLDVGGIVPLLAVAVMLELPSACVPAALVATDQLGLAAVWDVAITSVQIVAVVVPATLHRGAAGVVVGLVVSSALRLSLFAVLIARHFPGRIGGLPKGTLGAQVRYGIPLGLTVAAGVLNRSVDKWFVAAFDTHDVGVYSVAAQEIPLLAVLPYAGGAAVVTRVVDAFRRGDHDEARRYWLRQTSSMAAIVVPGSALLIVVAPELMVLVFTGDFVRGVLPFQLFTAITLHRVAEYGLVLRAADRSRELVHASVVLLGANTVFAGVGAASFGMVGAAAGTLLANGLAWLFILRRLAVLFGAPVRRSFAWTAWGGAIACGAGAASAAFLAVTVVSGTGSRLVVKLLCFSVVYAVLARSVGLRRLVHDAARIEELRPAAGAAT